MNLRVCAIVPLKVESQRLPNKNFLQLVDKPLAHYIFDTLLAVESLDKVYAYCSDPRLMDLLPAGVHWLPRLKQLDGNDVRANELFQGAVSQVSEDLIVLAQIPGPFVSPKTVEKCVSALRGGLYRSALTVRSHQTYAWYESKPLNYTPETIMRTQDLSPVLVETSGIYAFWRADYLRNGTRISEPVELVQVSELEAVDIDTPEDFEWAQHLAIAHRLSLRSSQQEAESIGTRLADKLKTFRHVAFDLDGVLIDSLPVMELAWERVMSDLSLSLKFSDYKPLIGRPFQSILSILDIPEESRKQVTLRYQEYSKELAEGIEPYPGVRMALSQLRESGYKISVVTSKDRCRAESLLTSALGTTVNSLVCGDDLPADRGKPSPDPLLMACIAVGVSPGETIYVGDMQVDRQAAEQAGVQYVHAGWGYGGLSYQAGVWFDSFERLTDWLLAEAPVVSGP